MPAQRKPIVDGKMRCSRCREWKAIGDDGEFNRSSARACGYQSRCRDCDHLVQRATREKNHREQMVKAARRRAREQGLPFDLTVFDIIIPDVCPVLGLALAMGEGRTRDNSPSLDKIDPAKGYVRGNVQVISDLANRMKQNANPEQLLAFSAWVQSVYGGVE